MAKSLAGNALGFVTTLLLVSIFVGLHPAAQAERPASHIQADQTLAVDEKVESDLQDPTNGQRGSHRGAARSLFGETEKEKEKDGSETGFAGLLASNEVGPTEKSKVDDGTRVLSVERQAALAKQPPKSVNAESGNSIAYGTTAKYGATYGTDATAKDINGQPAPFIDPADKQVDTYYIGRRVLYKNGYQNPDGREGFITSDDPWEIQWEDPKPGEIRVPEVGIKVNHADVGAVKVRNPETLKYWDLAEGQEATVEKVDADKGMWQLKNPAGETSPWVPIVGAAYVPQEGDIHRGTQMLSTANDWKDITLGHNFYNQYGKFNQALKTQLERYNKHDLLDKGSKALDATKQVGNKLLKYTDDLSTLTDFTAGAYAWSGVQHMKAWDQLRDMTTKAKTAGTQDAMHIRKHHLERVVLPKSAYPVKQQAQVDGTTSVEEGPTLIDETTSVGT